MLRIAALVLALAAVEAAAQAVSPFISDPDALDRRYGLAPGPEGAAREGLPPSEGAAMGDEVRSDTTREIDPRRRSQPGAVGSDLVNDRSAIIPGSRPFARW
jgi:hypothetical protein